MTIIGGGVAARACSDVLTNAGFRLRRTFEMDDEDRSPIVLGEVPSALNIARQAISAGRHLLITTPSQFSEDRLAGLFEERRQAQSLFLWSERRYHPGYHFVAGLLETDSTWRPRYIRQETLLTESVSTIETRWSLIESIGLIMSVVGETPSSVSATGITSPTRNTSEHMSLTLAFKDLQAFLQVGSGEAIDRRETMIASDVRKAFIDELNSSVPMRLVTDEARAKTSPSARWLSCPVPTREELARQQCLAFLDATLKASLAQDEAKLWVGGLSTIAAADESIRLGGIQTRIEPLVEEGPRFRLMHGPGHAGISPSSA